MTFPQKMLIVKDLTFILPPDFNGKLSDALEEYIKYRKKHLENEQGVDLDNKYNSTQVVLMNDNDKLSCVLYGIIEITEEGEYKIIESSSDIKENTNNNT